MARSAPLMPIGFLLMYFYFIALQYNDPDPWLWMGIYGVAALFCLLTFFKKGSPILFGIAIAGFAIGAAMHWPKTYEGIMSPMQASGNVELARESLGLIICALTTLVNLLILKRLQKS